MFGLAICMFSSRLPTGHGLLICIKQIVSFVSTFDKNFSINGWHQNVIIRFFFKTNIAINIRLEKASVICSLLWHVLFHLSKGNTRVVGLSKALLFNWDSDSIWSICFFLWILVHGNNDIVLCATRWNREA